MDLRKRAKGLSRGTPALFIALKSGKSPLLAKLLAFLAVAYDLSPDFIPVVGYLDDILPCLAALTLRMMRS